MKINIPQGFRDAKSQKRADHGFRAGLQGYLAHKKLPPPLETRKALGIGLP